MSYLIAGYPVISFLTAGLCFLSASDSEHSLYTCSVSPKLVPAHSKQCLICSSSYLYSWVEPGVFRRGLTLPTRNLKYGYYGPIND